MPSLLPTITLASSGLIGLPAGIAIMLEAEVGTCADTLIATIGRGSYALRTGVFHLLFNLVNALLGILLAPELAQLTHSSRKRFQVAMLDDKLQMPK